MATNFISKEQFAQAFQTLVTQRKKLNSRIPTKAETAQKVYHQDLLEKVKSYTPEGIVKGLADLQIKFVDAVENLSTELQSELDKLQELRTAIGVQKGNLQETFDTKIAANMLYILKQEQERAEKELQEQIQSKIEKHDEEVATHQAIWAKEKKFFETEQEIYKENLNKERNKELEEYRYKLERKYKVEEDEYSRDKEELSYKLQQENATKEKDWAKRNKYLVSQEEMLEKYKTKVDNFEEELKEKMEEARKKAIDKANQEARETTALFEKGVEGTAKVAQLEIGSLEQTILEQKEHISRLSADLKEALDRVSELSIKALENNRNRPSMN